MELVYLPPAADVACEGLDTHMSRLGVWAHITTAGIIISLMHINKSQSNNVNEVSVHSVTDKSPIPSSAWSSTT